MDWYPGRPPRCPKSRPRHCRWITDWSNESEDNDEQEGPHDGYESRSDTSDVEEEDETKADEGNISINEESSKEESVAEGNDADQVQSIQKNQRQVPGHAGPTQGKESYTQRQASRS